MPVSDYDQFIRHFESVKDRSRLFMFVLFDSRPSHHAIETFVYANFGWLDNLAHSTKIFGFAFIDSEGDEDRFANPSLRVAADFGIHANELPGVVAFTMLPNCLSVSKAVYLPLKAKLFSENQDVVENVFADLFSVFQAGLNQTDTEDDLIINIRDSFKLIKRKEQRRPILEFLGERARSLATLPDKLLEAAATSFGKALGTGLGG